ncbi:MAG: ABC transporter ATP-binding protein [Candidatus Hodarchaeales archaeon]
MKQESTQLINLKNITKIYSIDGISIEAIKNLSLSINKGDFVVIMGPSGSGKTTLLNLISGLSSSDEGTIKLLNNDITQLSDKELSKLRIQSLGLIFQFYNLHQGLTALENVELPLLISGLKPLSKRRKRASELLELVDLANHFEKYPYELSGGEKQRVGIARSLANNPEIILADEPTGDLDSTKAEEIMKILYDLRLKGKTIVVVTHDITLIRPGMRFIFLEDGLIKKDFIVKKENVDQLYTEFNQKNYQVDFLPTFTDSVPYVTSDK